MLFSSFSFLFLFLPAALLVSLAAPRRVRNAALLLVSLVFYAWGEPIMVLLMLFTVLVDFLLGLWIAHSKAPRRVLLLAVFFNLSLLFYYKYAAFFLGLLGIVITPPRLPLGISFYTFQALSYVIDVYRQDAKAETNAIDFGTYVALFPQLIAGPIVRYTDVASELQERKVTVAGAAAGARRFVAGLFKKVVIANPAGALFHSLASLEASEISLVGAWLAVIAFSLQIYFDFSGYSDMARGLGRILGFHFPENFNHPYVSRGFTDFWRRWHITLSTWFKEYVYIPLGGNRRGRARTVLNLFVVWLLTGLWHGAAFNFILWGLYWFLLLVIEKFLLHGFFYRLPRAGAVLLTLPFILFGWMLFAFDGSTAYLSPSRLLPFLGAAVGGTGSLLGAQLYRLVHTLPFLTLAAIAATPLPRRIWKRLNSSRFGDVFATVLPLIGFFVSLCYLSDAAYNPFLYFRF